MSLGSESATLGSIRRKLDLKITRNGQRSSWHSSSASTQIGCKSSLTVAAPLGFVSTEHGKLLLNLQLRLLTDSVVDQHTVFLITLALTRAKLEVSGGAVLATFGSSRGLLRKP